MTNNGPGPVQPAPDPGPGPARRPRWKFGAIALGVSLAFFVAGAASLPAAFSGGLAPVTAQSRAAAATSTANTAPSAMQAASIAPPALETGAPPDVETTPLVAPVAVQASGPQPAFATTASELLATLPIKGRAPKTGYDRALFGQAWADVDRNGCDTRNDILQRDLTGITFTNSVPCKVQSGTLADPYTATSISFLRGSGTSSRVQIDHVVALSDAWQKGAQQLTTEKRTAFANDPLNLQATDGPTNQKKGDGDAATWLPPNKGFRCEYVARQISLKAADSLWVTQAEHDAMSAILASCADQLAPTNQAPAAPVPAPEVAPAEPAPVAAAPAPAAVPPAPLAPARVVPAPAPAAPAPGVYYANCAAARAAGAAPLFTGQAGYRAGLDRDSDGVACES
ncbi:DUF1524 domain-containing protein [Pseudarthrobacter quantipunctorum]|uniref:DUF1524 domain-containing protein n=1 Tax=Pseudarthrobacter quantipunctorum TaxID=3128980 RepID=A0ABZ2R646_9MICC